MLNVILHCLISFTGIPFEAIEARNIVDKNILRDDLFFVAIFLDLMYFEDLLDGVAALIKSNQCFEKWLHSITQYARKNLLCSEEKAVLCPII